MNRKMVYYMTGRIILLEGALLLVPLIVSLIYQDVGTVPFLITIAICAAVGGALSGFFRNTSQVIFAKEGFLITALAWVVLSAILAQRLRDRRDPLRALRPDPKLYRRLL